ncbi:MAG: PASTA domain-containing protein, partial [Kofleriaceae bacterium]|nr:PASTA domain-containing protein [Kofleriaceae bacterium]
MADRLQGPAPVISPAYRADVALARLGPGEPPRLLLWTNIGAADGFYTRTDFTNTSAGCRGLTGDPGDHGTSCRALLIVDPATLAVERILKTTPLTRDYESNTSNQSNALQPNPAIAADLDGDGSVEIVAGGTVWTRVAGAWTLAWGTRWTPLSTAVADLDGDGSLEVIHAYHWAPGGGNGESSPCGIYVHTAEGALKRRIALPGCFFSNFGLLTVADADGDGAPDILVARRGQVHAIRADGRMLWTFDVPSALETLPPLTAQIGRDARIVVQPELRTGNTTIVVYDLDGDGAPEVVLNTSSGTFFLDGRDGSVRAVYGLSGFDGANIGNPANVAVLDLDNDGTSEIVTVSGCPYSLFQHEVGYCDSSFTALAARNDDWLPGPKNWPGAAYVDGAVGDGGRVQFNPAVGTRFRTPQQRGNVGDPRRVGAASFTYQAHDGVSASAPATVAIRIDPPNRPPKLTMPLHFAAAPSSALRFTATAVDPDAGDTLTWSIVGAGFYCPGTGPSVGAATGVVDCPQFIAYEDAPVVIVRVTDSQGAFDEQTVTVFRLGAPLAMPDVVGLARGDAEGALASAGLNVGSVTTFASAAPAGQVLAQNPAAGTTVAAGSVADLTVSSGPQPVVVPFVVGQDLAAARLALQGAGLAMSVTPQASASVPRNQVMAQTPAGGTQLVPAPANVVALTVSSGAVPSGTIAQIVVEPGNPARLVGDTLPMTATAVFADGTASDVTLNALWTSSAGSVASVDTTGQVRALAAGSTQIRASVGAVTGQTTLGVAAQAADVTPPTAAIASPADGADVTGPIAVTGTATDATFHRYELAIAPAGEPAWTVIAQGTTPVSGGTLGTLDPTTLVNDQYTLRLTVHDRGGNVSEATATVQVRGERKVGLFTLGFTDLDVALTGVPITVTRTYDSRDKARGDFGIGWRLGFNTLRLRTNRVLGTGWLRTQSGITSTLTARGPHKVSLTLPDGRVEAFDLQLAPTSGVGVLQSTRVAGFAPRPGTLGRLEGLDNPDLLVVNDGAEDVLVDDGTLDVYDPRRFRYTTLDGTQIDIHRTEGVKRIADRNGNSITIGPSGITHSAGPSVAFTRDAQGRITAIRDLNGHTQSYAYDANGDLVAHTDAVGGVSRYTYDRHHGLVDMRNAAGTRVTRNDYDASGRLVAMTDADGRQITFTHDDAANEEIVTDRLGRQTRLAYDANGNVTRQEKAVTIDGTLVSAVTTSAFDALGNETSTTDPDGRRIARAFDGLKPTTTAVDPAGLDLVSTFAYNARNDVTQAVDPAGRPTTFGYDASGNLTTYAFPA